MHRIPLKIKDFSRKLRSEMTEAETRLWQHLRARQINGFKFRRQHPVGNYILDFACIEVKLAIEVDGGQHNELQVQDNLRTAWLETQGWRVLRFWNNDVTGNIEGVLDEICKTLSRVKFTSPPPS